MSSKKHVPPRRDFPDIENAPYSFNAGGVKRVQARAYDKVSAEVMEAHGGGEVFPLLYADFADNGNMLESEEMSKRHGVCGDPKIVSVRPSRSSVVNLTG